MRLPLIVSLSKCHLCHQYYYTAGKQPINILMGEISFSFNLLPVGEICFSSPDYLMQRTQTAFRVRTYQKVSSGGESGCVLKVVEDLIASDI